MMNTRKEILVVDDEPHFRVLLYKKLKSAGYPVVLAQNGEEALVNLWEKQSIALVLLDVRLPHINGMNIFNIIRKDFPDKKIIVSSALQKDEQEFIIEGADDYYYKGDDLDCLIEKVDKISNNKRIRDVLREDEKRSSKRVPVNVFASCETVDHLTARPPVHFFSYTKDLSESGGRFVVAEDIKIGQHFAASLELPTNFLPILIDCEVVWVKKMEQFNLKVNRNNEVGVKFVKLDLPRDEENLKNYLSYV